ncbi:sensor domain-containing protein [Candidatus Endoriftia persephone]|jgi:diguanylate cyclase (GGDEF)-like protein/PAS domain S-box-containing protein|uniref:EAL domain-containing protein n=3 Tax=Gammaproteobacteria TaxID=1236 RepID=A0A9J6ZWL0_9GAMM|nr:EAL domain-containing protein [Candidatus Endoriftia persephone]EGV52205.1 putative diguanylate cyclase/phosphodiesterase [endosymbiont of Riftia pachyptila (vent Ph05)]EGW54432.1 putative signaling protein [endosymbiont of Tevnia jerichonana (vent Tica)]USF87196.1 EAL domain-containing protein [Candidatus Endoriftia persephone]
MTPPTQECTSSHDAPFLDFQRLFEQAPLPYQSLDGKGNVLAVNQAWLNTLGYQRDEVVGRWFGDFLHADDSTLFRTHFAKFKQNGQTHQTELRIRHKDGSERLVAFEGRIASNPQGQLQSYCIFTDITKQHAILQALQESQQRFQHFMDLIPAQAFIRDAQGRYLYGNRAWQAQFELPLEQLLGMTDRDLYPLPTAIEFERTDRQAMQQNEPLRTEQLGIGADHQPHAWRVCKFPIQGQDGNGCLGGLLFDITAEKESAVRLQLFRDLLDQSMEAILVLAYEDGRLIDVNVRTCHYTGHSNEQILTLRLPQISTYISDWDQFREQITHAGSLYFLDRLRCRDGNLLDVEVYATQVDLDQSRYIIATARDITERKATDEKLRQAAAVFESTAEGVMICDPQDRIVAVNRAFTEITGYSLEEMVGQKPSILSSGLHDNEFFQQIRSALHNSGRWQGEIWNRRMNGESFPEWLTISEVRDPNGELTHYVSVFSDITTVKQAQQKLEHLAQHDPLTGLPNRLLIDEMLEHTIGGARREDKRSAVMFLDLDGFKTINDSLGHRVGDRVLQKVADRLRRALRGPDMVARLGGDEFLVVIERLDQQADVAIIAEKLLAQFREAFPVEGRELFITASIGISLFPGDGATAADLIQHADSAMYRAKESGRNAYQFYETALTTNAQRHLDTASQLRHAIARKQFVVHYQPQFDLLSGALSGMEALVRWQQTDSRLVGPGEFITIAEQSGLIGEIGAQVMQQACHQAARWLKAGARFERIAINLSAIQITRGNLQLQVKQCLQRTGLPPENLELEITESLFIDASEAILEQINALRALGITFSIDDFGTGYSSLAYLKRLPVERLKIDQSFIHDIPGDPGNAAIASAVIGIGQSLGLRVIAEGIETEQQRLFLLQHNCPYGQGYLLGRPVPTEHFAKQFL